MQIYENNMTKYNGWWMKVSKLKKTGRSTTKTDKLNKTFYLIIESRITIQHLKFISKYTLKPISSANSVKSNTFKT